MKLWFKNGGWASRRGRRVSQQMKLSDVKRIAVIRHAALGDMVHTRPFLIELRKACPDAYITLSVTSNYTHGAPDDLIDKLHVIYGSDRRDVSLRKQIAKARELGSQDIIFDLAATPRSFWTCLLNKAKLKIGFPYYAFQRSFFYDIAVFRSDLRFEAEVMLEMLNTLGIKTSVPLIYNMPVEPIKRGNPYVIYFTGASTPRRCWLPERYAKLISNMASLYPSYEHIVLEGRTEWESIDPVMKLIADNDNITGLKGLDLDEVTALVKGASLMVANDTGVRNLAIACEVPTVGIFHETYPFRYWPRYGFHDVVFNQDATLPSVEDVERAVSGILDQLD